MLGERYSEAQESFRRSLELSPQQTDVASRLELAAQTPKANDLGRQFPRVRPLWDTLLLSTIKELYVLDDRVLCLQEPSVTALRDKDGTVEWVTELAGATTLQTSPFLRMWSREPRADASLYGCAEGKEADRLSEGDKLFAFHPSDRKLVVGNIDLWLADWSLKRLKVRRKIKLVGHEKRSYRPASVPTAITWPAQGRIAWLFSGRARWAAAF